MLPSPSAFSRVLALLLPAAPLQIFALVVPPLLPLGDTLPPSGAGGQPTDPGFAYVGRVQGSTGVYLGNGWVLTADHVGAGNFSLGGSTYNYNGVDSHQIGRTDLRLFRLATSPTLAPLRLAETTPALRSGLVLIAAGSAPASAAPTTWYVDTADSSNLIWRESPFVGADLTISGYQTTATGRRTRWGTNTVDSIEGAVTIGRYAPTDFIRTVFGGNSNNPTTAFEAQAVTHDSGGGVFHNNAGVWELAGTITATGQFSNQPGGPATAIPGNVTFAIDLADHVAEIRSYLLAPVPEPRSAAFLLGAFVASWALLRRRARA